MQAMKAQISIEAIFIFAAALMIFTAMSMLSFSRQNDLDAIGQQMSNANECEKLADEVRSVFMLDWGASSNIAIESDFKISNGAAYFGGVICSLCCNVTNGTATNFNMNRGTIALSNIGGKIRIGAA